MNDVKSLHTTKNKNKKFHAYCVKKQFSLYVSSYDVYIKKSVFAIYSYIDLIQIHLVNIINYTIEKVQLEIGTIVKRNK